jgi:hypothetical protein
MEGRPISDFVAEHISLRPEVLTIRTYPPHLKQVMHAARQRQSSTLTRLGLRRLNGHLAPITINILPLQAQQFPRTTAGIEHGRHICAHIRAARVEQTLFVLVASKSPVSGRFPLKAYNGFGAELEWSSLDHPLPNSPVEHFPQEF